jgi:hypothetical protein
MEQIDVASSNQIFRVLEEWKGALQWLGGKMFSEIPERGF